MAAWTLEEALLKAEEIDSPTLHLKPGFPPLARGAVRDLRPVDPAFDPVTPESLMRLLSPLVDPERWDHLEEMGEGEISVPSRVAGRPLRVSLFKGGGEWSAVFYLKPHR